MLHPGRSLFLIPASTSQAKLADLYHLHGGTGGQVKVRQGRKPLSSCAASWEKLVPADLPPHLRQSLADLYTFGRTGGQEWKGEAGTHSGIHWVFSLLDGHRLLPHCEGVTLEEAKQGIISPGLWLPDNGPLEGPLAACKVTGHPLILRSQGSSGSQRSMGNRMPNPRSYTTFKESLDSNLNS